MVPSPIWADRNVQSMRYVCTVHRPVPCCQHTTGPQNVVRYVCSPPAGPVLSSAATLPGLMSLVWMAHPEQAVLTGQLVHPMTTFTGRVFHPMTTFTGRVFHPMTTFTGRVFHPMTTFTGRVFHPMTTFTRHAFHPMTTFTGHAFRPMTTFNVMLFNL